jgi:hypothetical protein
MLDSLLVRPVIPSDEGVRDLIGAALGAKMLDSLLVRPVIPSDEGVEGSDWSGAEATVRSLDSRPVAFVCLPWLDARSE